MNRNVDRALSGGENTGDVLKYFSELDDILERNSGVNDNKTLTSDASDPPCPIENNTYTKVKITDDAIHITNIDKSCLTAEVELTINFPSNFWTEILETETESIDPYVKAARLYRNRITKWFVGLKSAIHVFDAYRVYSFNKKTNCEQTEALYENTAVRFLKPQEELDEKPNIYTTWKHVFSGDENVCGAYFTLQDILDMTSGSKGLTVRFEVCVPLDDFLPLSGFTMYPNKVFENLSLELKMGIQQNLIVAQVDPLEEFRKMVKHRKGSEIALTALYNHLQNDIPAYTRHFIQMNDYFNTVIYTINDTGVTSNLKMVQFSCTKGKLLNLRSHINGFNIKDSVLRELQDKYSKRPLIIPAQYCDYQAFSQKPMSGGLKCNTTYGMTNVASLIFLFPRTHNEITCCQNPHFSSIQVQVDNKPFPDKPFSTLEAAHTMYNLTNAGLDSLFSPSEEFSYSLNFRELEASEGLTIKDDDGNIELSEEKKWVREPTKDNTSYCFVCSTERLCGYGNFCDGLTKDNAHITLTCALEGDSNHNPYITHPITGVHGNDRSPIMIVCQDCFWVFRTGETAEFVNNNKYFYEEQTEGETPDYENIHTYSGRQAKRGGY